MAGRRHGLTEEVLRKCVELYSLGASDKDVAGAIGVAGTTIQNWKKRRMFRPALDAKGRVNSDVVSKLRSRVDGFTYTETKEKFDADGNLIGLEVITKKIVPDVSALKFWLTNRNPGEWANKEVVEHYDGDQGIETINKGRERVAEMRRQQESEDEVSE